VAKRIEVRLAAQGQVLEDYITSEARVALIRGPLGSGKTTGSCMKMFRIMCAQTPNAQGIRPTRFFAIRNTYPDLLGTTAKDWLSMYGDLGRFKAGGLEPPTHYVSFRLEDGTRVQSEVIFIALDREEHKKKLKGAQATGIYLSEAKELHKAVVDEADLRHGRYPSMALAGVDCDWHGMFGDTNSPDDLNWYFKLAEEVKPEGWEFFDQPGGLIKVNGIWMQNPKAENLANLPTGYYLRGMEGKSKEWIKVNLANEYGSLFTGKPVYSEYNDRIHVAREPLAAYRGLPLIIGVDFGLTPAAAITQLSRRGQFRVLDELVSEGMGIERFLRDSLKPFLAQKYAGLQVLIAPDPAGRQRVQTDERTCIDMIRAAGFAVKEPHTNGFRARREAVSHFMTRMVDGEPAYLLSPTCKMLRRGKQGGYHYKLVHSSTGDRVIEEVADNDFTHPSDAEQYAALAAVGPMLGAQNNPSKVRRGSSYKPGDSHAGY